MPQESQGLEKFIEKGQIGGDVLGDETKKFMDDAEKIEETVRKWDKEAEEKIIKEKQKEIFGGNVEEFVERFKDDIEGLKKLIKDWEEAAKDKNWSLLNRERAGYRIETLKEAMNKITEAKREKGWATYKCKNPKCKKKMFKERYTDIEPPLVKKCECGKDAKLLGYTKEYTEEMAKKL